MKLSLALAASLLALPPRPTATIKDYNAIEWRVSGNLPPGAEYHLIYEDPVSHAVQTLVRFPSGYSLPEHAHSHDETILVLKGKLLIALNGKESAVERGGYAVIPASSPHSLKAKGKVEMLVSLAGPFDIKGLSSPK